MRNLTLGEFITLLQTLLYPTNYVTYDFGSLRPTKLRSYRGYYEDLALGFGEGPEILSQDLLLQCQNAIGETFTGYKGGDYVATPSTKLWAAEWSLTGSTAIVGIIDCKYITVIKTEWIDD